MRSSHTYRNRCESIASFAQHVLGYFSYLKKVATVGLYVSRIAKGIGIRMLLPSALAQ